MTNGNLDRARQNLIGAYNNPHMFGFVYVGDCLRYLADTLQAIHAPAPPREVSRSHAGLPQDSDGHSS